MARNEQDREDILREATALIERIEVELPAYAEPLIVGFRRDGSVSVFVGADPVFQFNSRHQLRRAFRAGTLLKAERGRLVSLERRRTAAQVQLLRTELDAASTAMVLAEANQHLQVLGDHLREGTFKVLGQVPAAIDVVVRVRNWLASFPKTLTVASRPHAG